MNAPAPDANHARLSRLVGTWIGEEHMHPSPWSPTPSTATGTSRSRLDLGGFFLICEYEQHRDGALHFQGHGVYGWDAHRGLYTMHWYDSSGFDPGAPAYGTWVDDTLDFRKESPMGHSRYLYEFGDGFYRFSIHSSKDGKTWQAFMDARYERQK